MIAYVLAVNPQILESTGGTCNGDELCYPEEFDLLGDSCIFVSSNPAAEACLQTLRMSLTTATAAASLVSCFIIGFFANLPMGLAPGIGINIYFAYQVVAQGTLTYEQALVAVFIEGFIFIALSMSGVRGAVMRYMPASIAFAGSAGMGLLLAYTGLRNLGVIVFDETTLTTLGGCPSNSRNSVYTGPDILPDNFTQLTQEARELLKTPQVNISDVTEAAPTIYSCQTDQMRSATMWLGIAGGIIMSLLTMWRVKGALFIGVAFVTIISWIPGHAASYLGADSSIPGGQARLDTFTQVVAAPTLEGTGVKWDWSAVGNGHFWLVLFTLLYIDILDATGVLLSMSYLLDGVMKMDFYNVKDMESVKEKKAALAELNGGEEPSPYIPFVSEKKEFKGQQWAFLSDGIGIVVSSMMGISPVAVYLESAVGIEEGGRTGIVPIVVSFFFFVSLFFSPIFSSIPPYATGPALILVGIMLMAHADHIPWDEPQDSIPAFLTIIVMPLTFSVAYGVIAGICMYIILRIPEWLVLIFRKSKDYFCPPSIDDDDAMTAASSSMAARSVLRKRAIARKVFGNASRQGSDAETADISFRDVTETTEPIPVQDPRKLRQSKSHQGWYNSHSPTKQPYGSPTPSYRRFVSENGAGSSAEDIDRMDAYRAPPMFPTLSTSMKRSASLHVGDLQKAAGSSDDNNVGLFGDFQLLDLDLGGSTSSGEEEEIQLQSDGTLSLVERRRKSVDLSMFSGAPQGHEDAAATMTTDKRASEQSSEAGGIHDRNISLTGFLDQSEPKEQTEPPAPSGTRGMQRVQSQAAIRLQNLFSESHSSDDDKEK